MIQISLSKAAVASDDKKSRGTQPKNPTHALGRTTRLLTASHRLGVFTDM